MLQNIVMILDHMVSTFTLDYFAKSKNLISIPRITLFVKFPYKLDIRQVSLQIGQSFMLCHQLVPLRYHQTNV